MIVAERVDWNCPQRVTPRLAQGEANKAVAPLVARLHQAEEKPICLRGDASGAQAALTARQKVTKACDYENGVSVTVTIAAQAAS